MKTSIVIPVWNGESVITDCLDALYANTKDAPLEVICVDNASSDKSAEIIAIHFPQVHLILQPVNLGFAGGVNAGINVAQGDCIILLNQDCMVTPGWLPEIIQSFQANPQFGIAGCTILNVDGTVDHAGAVIRRPDGYGYHLKEIGEERPREVDYVTGAVFAILRKTWQAVGQFDEDFYPAYFEECDYCYRAREKGIQTAYVPAARVKHLFSNRSWQDDTIKQISFQHRSRYRFISKHFTPKEVTEFFKAELIAIESESYLEQSIGRLAAARYILWSLNNIIKSRRRDLDIDISSTHHRLLSVGFTQIIRQSLNKSFIDNRKTTFLRLKNLQQQEYELLNRIYFKHPLNNHLEPLWKRLLRLLILRPLSFVIGRDYLLLSELNTIHVARMDQMDLLIRLDEDRLYLLETMIKYVYN